MDYTKDALLIEDLIKDHEDKLLEQSTLDLNHNPFEMIYSNDTTTPVFNDDYDDYNDTLDYVPYSMRPETYIVPILFAIIFVIGVLGNGTLIVIFLKHRTMRNVPNMYIVSLAVGDLFVILFCVPFTSTVYTVESWPYGLFVCKFSEFIKDLSVGVSVFTLTALSADRYFAIVDPMRKLHGRRATRITCITIAGIWFLAIALALPSALFSYVRAIDQDPSRIFHICYPFPPQFGDRYPQAVVMIHFLVYYAIPLVFIGTFYIIMARHLVLSTRNMPGEAQGQAKQIQARKKVAKMIMSFVVIFAICFFPSHLFLLWFYYYPDSENNFNEFWNACRIIGFCFSFINSCVNPITLYCVSGTFRKQFNEHLFCCICDADGRYRAGRRAGLVCGCVSLSGAGPGGHIYGGGNSNCQYRNGYSSSARGLYRGPTLTMSGGFGGQIKRKSTWDTQSTMSHNNLYNLTPTTTTTNNTSITAKSGMMVHQNVNQGSSSGTPTSIITTTTTTTTKLSDNPSKHSNTSNGKNTSNSIKPSGTDGSGTSNLNSTFPLTHHPYQKDYQEYINRINALEKGDSPPKPGIIGINKIMALAGSKSGRSTGSGGGSMTELNKMSKEGQSPKGNKKYLGIGSQSISMDEYTVTSFINLPEVEKASSPSSPLAADATIATTTTASVEINPDDDANNGPHDPDLDRHHCHNDDDDNTPSAIDNRLSRDDSDSGNGDEGLVEGDSNHSLDNIACECRCTTTAPTVNNPAVGDDDDDDCKSSSSGAADAHENSTGDKKINRNVNYD